MHNKEVIQTSNRTVGDIEHVNIHRNTAKFKEIPILTTVATLTHVQLTCFISLGFILLMYHFVKLVVMIGVFEVRSTGTHADN